MTTEELKDLLTQRDALDRQLENSRNEYRKKIKGMLEQIEAEIEEIKNGMV